MSFSLCLCLYLRLSRVFKEETVMNLKEYRRNLRVGKQGREGCNYSVNIGKSHKNIKMKGSKLKKVYS